MTNKQELSEIEKLVGNYNGDTVVEMVANAVCDIHTGQKCRNPACNGHTRNMYSVHGLCSKCAMELITEPFVATYCKGKDNPQQMGQERDI